MQLFLIYLCAMKIVFATNNGHKVAEVQSLLPKGVEIMSLMDCGITDDIAETEQTLEGNALLKARYIYKRYGFSCFADDTGLEVTALGGAPGVFSARYAESLNIAGSHDSDANNTLLLRNMTHLEGAEQRGARFRTVIAFINTEGAEHLFEGIVDGHIAYDLSGAEGFGYDPIFIPNDPTNSSQRSFAEMSIAEKGAISHRGRAVEKFVNFLKNIV